MKATMPLTWAIKVTKGTSLITLLNSLKKSSVQCLSNSMEPIIYHWLGNNGRLILTAVSWFPDFQSRVFGHLSVAIDHIGGFNYCSSLFLL